MKVLKKIFLLGVLLVGVGDGVRCDELHEVSAEGMAAVTKMYLNVYKRDVNLKNEKDKNKTPLHYAMKGTKDKAPNSELITLLLEKKANVNVQDDDRQSVLHDFVDGVFLRGGQSLDKAEVALDVILKDEQLNKSLEDKDGRTALNYAKNLFKIQYIDLSSESIKKVSEDSEEKLEKFIELFERKLTKKESQVVVVKKIEKVKVPEKPMIKRTFEKKFPYGVNVSYLSTPLHEIVKEDNLENVQELIRIIENEARREIAQRQTIKPKQSTEEAKRAWKKMRKEKSWSEFSDEEKENYLKLEVAVDINQVDGDGRTPLHIAARNGNLAIVKLLLGRGAKKHKKDLNGKGQKAIDMVGKEKRTDDLGEIIRLLRAP